MLNKLFSKLKSIFDKGLVSDSDDGFFDEGPLVSDEGKARVCGLEYFGCMRGIYAEYLSRNGYSYFLTGSADEFLSEVSAASAVILDDRQPEIHGFALARKLKEDNASLPALIITADCSVESEAEFCASGADAILYKPVSEAEFIECLNRLLVKGSAEPVVPEKVVEKKRGRKPFSFLDVIERNVKELSESGLSKAEFARKKKMSLSSLKNEVRIAEMPEASKKIIRDNIDCFKKSFFEHITKLKEEKNISALCSEIAERGKSGSYYDLSALKQRVNGYLTLEKNDEV
ncbi:response regulator [Candidatus Woesearchaeota archaeon]|nr:response regulator [Candidatus Woesearchaeota archaeon]